MHYLCWHSLIRKVDGYANNPGNSSTTKLGEHIPKGYLVSTIWGFDHIENKHTLYGRKDCIKKSLYFFKKTCKRYNWFWKEKNISVNKRRIKVTSRWIIIFGEKDS